MAIPIPCVAVDDFRNHLDAPAACRAWRWMARRHADVAGDDRHRLASGLRASAPSPLESGLSVSYVSGMASFSIGSGNSPSGATVHTLTKADVGALARADQAGGSLLQSTADPAFRKDRPAYTIRLEILEESRYGLGRRFDEVVDRSPMLKKGLSQLKSKGYRIELSGGQTFLDRSQKLLSISRGDLLKNAFLAQALSHELGHLSDENDVADFRGPVQYVDARMRSEGEAVLANLEVRQELLDAGLGDIGVLGSPSFAGEAVRDWNAYRAGAIDLATLKGRLAEGYRSESPTGGQGLNYVQYYQRQYEERVRFDPGLRGRVIPGG